MDVVEAIRCRKSVRGYKSTPVSKQIVTEILEIATRSPSGVNIQPWEFNVLGGKVLDDLEQALQAQFLAGAEPCPDFPLVPFTGIYRKRQLEVGNALYQLMGIAWKEKEKRDQWMLRMYNAYGAPNIIIIAIDEEVSNNFTAIFSLGAVTQTIALAAVNLGLGTCIQRSLVHYPPVVRQITGIPKQKKLAVGMSIGYPDWDFPANKLQSIREPLSDIVSWLGL